MICLCKSTFSNSLQESRPMSQKHFKTSPSGGKNFSHGSALLVIYLGKETFLFRDPKLGIFDAHGISFPSVFFYAQRIGGAKTALIREAHKYFSESSSFFFEKEVLISKDRLTVELHNAAALYVPTSQKSGKEKTAMCSFIVLRVISVCFSDLICNYTVTYDRKYEYRLK